MGEARIQDFLRTVLPTQGVYFAAYPKDPDNSEPMENLGKGKVIRFSVWAKAEVTADLVQVNAPNQVKKTGCNTELTVVEAGV